MAESNLVRLQLINGSCRELINPKLGREFLAGELEDGASFGIFRRGILRSVEFLLLPEISSQAMHFTRGAIGELLSHGPFPTEATIGYLEAGLPVQKIRVLGVARGFLFSDYHQNPAIPVASLGTIELDCA